ncbi:MAG: hypothetical protein GKR89_16755 [Candidatus Latescibacteria bacterium]|nr:hypothetical protein [Candidatus Latescibacterota bacterium]
MRHCLPSQLIAATLFLLGVSIAAPAQEQAPADTASYTLRGFDQRIQHGIDLIYNLRFDQADSYFAEVIAADPDNPLGYFFRAMVVWWQILIDLEDRSHDEAFYRRIEECIKICDRRLDRDEMDFDAILFKAGAIGFRGRLRGDRNQFLKAARDGMRCLPLLDKSRQLEPTNKDILFGQGIYNYFAEVIPQRHSVVRPVMWLLPDGDREKGIDQLRQVTREGRYARTEAAYFLVQIYRVFEDEDALALPYLEELYGRYPANALFHRYTARVLVELGHWKRGTALFEDYIAASRQNRPGYHLHGLIESLYYVGKYAFVRGAWDRAETALTAADSLGAGQQRKRDQAYTALANLLLGMTYDAQDRRVAAVERYRRVKKLPRHNDSHQRAKQYIKNPYQSPHPSSAANGDAP